MTQPGVSATTVEPSANIDWLDLSHEALAFVRG
jgi:hypothetical protein